MEKPAMFPNSTGTSPQKVKKITERQKNEHKQNSC